jgi:hypothetical protein
MCWFSDQVSPGSLVTAEPEQGMAHQANCVGSCAVRSIDWDSNRDGRICALS